MRKPETLCCSCIDILTFIQLQQIYYNVVDPNNKGTLLRLFRVSKRTEAKMERSAGSLVRVRDRDREKVFES